MWPGCLARLMYASRWPAWTAQPLTVRDPGLTPHPQRHCSLWSTYTLVPPIQQIWPQHLLPPHAPPNWKRSEGPQSRPPAPVRNGPILSYDGQNTKLPPTSPELTQPTSCSSAAMTDFGETWPQHLKPWHQKMNWPSSTTSEAWQFAKRTLWWVMCSSSANASEPWWTSEGLCRLLLQPGYSVCNYKKDCTCSLVTDFSYITVRDTRIHGLEDEEIHLDVLGQQIQDMSLYEVLVCWSKGEHQTLHWPPPCGQCHDNCSCHQLLQTLREVQDTTLWQQFSGLWLLWKDRSYTQQTGSHEKLHCIKPHLCQVWHTSPPWECMSPGPVETTASHTQGAGVTQWHHCSLWCPVFRQWYFTTHGHKHNHTRPPHLQSVLWCMGEARIWPPIHHWCLAQSNPGGRPRTWPLCHPAQCYQFHHLPCHGWHWLPVLPGWHKTPIQTEAAQETPHHRHHENDGRQQLQHWHSRCLGPPHPWHLPLWTETWDSADSILHRLIQLIIPV